MGMVNSLRPRDTYMSQYQIVVHFGMVAPWNILLMYEYFLWFNFEKSVFTFQNDTFASLTY